MPCKTILHSFFYLADHGVQDSALGTYIEYLPIMAGILYMYLAYLINLRGGKREERGEKRKGRERKEEKEGEEEGEKTGSY